MHPFNRIRIHGHRGARGLYPENSLIGFLNAVQLGVDAIELDVVISKDLKVVVSHEAWMNEVFCTFHNGKAIEKNAREKYNLFQMDYAQIKEFNCGLKVNPDFPHQITVACYKPLLSEVIQQIEAFTDKNNIPPVLYNIEIKTEEDAGELFNPKPELFCKLVYTELKKFPVFSRLILQSFDVRILQELKKINNNIILSYLIENKNDLKTNLKKLGFLPDFYCPEYILLNETLVDDLNQLSIEVMTWTVNNPKDMLRMVNMGVSNIISDYPDIAIQTLRKNIN